MQPTDDWGDFELTDSFRLQGDRLAWRARRGEREARDYLYAALATKVERFLAAWRRRRLPAGYDQDDLRQDAYLAFIDLLQDWRGRDFLAFFLAFFPWRLRHLVERAMRQARPQPEGATAGLVGGPVLLGAPAGVGIEEALAVSQLLAELSEGHREVARLRIGDDLSFREIARRLGWSERTVRSRWGEARAYLAERLQGRQPAPLPRREHRFQQAGPRPVAVLRLIAHYHGHTGADGLVRVPKRQQVCRDLGITAAEHRAIVAAMIATGCLVGRARGHSGRLATRSAKETHRRVDAYLQGTLSEARGHVRRSA